MGYVKPPNLQDLIQVLLLLFLRTERRLVDEITRKRKNGHVDYAEVASLERVQSILQEMTEKSYDYVPIMVEKIFYKSDKDAAGYANARSLTSTQYNTVQILANNLIGEIYEAADTAYQSVEKLYAIGRLENDPYRSTALKAVMQKEAAGTGWTKNSAEMEREFQNRGITAFVDKAGRHWTLTDYCNMCTRTTARQAEVAAVLTADDHDLWQISRIGSTCPVCAPLEGRVYSKSGQNPDYPPLSIAFGKIDPNGPEELTNTYLNIHPNCLHSLIKYTTIGKSEKQIQKEKDFSSVEKNPLTHDPRTKKQMEAYREKERHRRRLLDDIRQHKEYRSILGKDITNSFDKFRELKYNKSEVFRFVKLDYQRRKKLMDHPEWKLPNAENAKAAEEKFTKYLFDGIHPEGLAKGKAFTTRLGYNLDNWQELRKEILNRASWYPATFRDNNGYGDRYSQKIVIYGKKGTPANVVVGWTHKPDGSVLMSSAYIKEV